MRQWSVAILGLVVIACGGGGSTKKVVRGPVTLIAYDRDGDLHIIDPADGSSAEEIDTFYDTGAATVDLGRVSGSIYNPVTNKIWMGLGGRNSPCEACVLALDILTGEGVLVADNSGVHDGFPGVAISAANRIFVHEGDGSGLFELDNTTGVATEVNATTDGGTGNGMTFSAAGVLYLAADDRVYTVDQTTFVATEIADQTKAGFPTAESGEIVCLATRPADGVIFGIYKDGAGSGNPGDAYLITLAPTTGVMTYVGTMTENFDGLAFVPTSSLP